MSLFCSMSDSVEFVLKVTNRKCLKAGYVTVVSFGEHGASGTIDDLYHLCLCIVYRVVVHFTVQPVSFRTAVLIFTFTKLRHTTSRLTNVFFKGKGRLLPCMLSGNCKQAPSF